MKLLTSRFSWEIFLDIRLYVACLFVAGLFTLDAPFHGDHWHRQAIVAEIARNFYELGINPFYPQSNICGALSPNYFASEFPLLQTLQALGYYLFGEEFWWGRLVNWAVSCLGLVFFAKLTDAIAGPRAGLYASLALIGSIFITYGRKYMPDTFSLSLVIIGTYYLWRYLETGNWRRLAGGGLLVALGILSKIPSVTVVTFLGVAYLDGMIPFRRKVMVSGVLALCAALMGSWYFYWMPHLQSITNCEPLIYPVSFSEGWDQIVHQYPYKTFDRLRVNAWRSWLPFYGFLLGVVVAVLRGKWRIVAAGAAYALLSFLFILKTGHVFPTHVYYVIPILPLMAFFIGFLMNSRWIPPAGSLVVMLLLTIPAIQFTIDDLRLYPDLPEIELEKKLDELGVGREDLIMVMGKTLRPTLMYYTHRRGWSVNPDIVDHPKWFPDYRRDGLTTLILDRRMRDDTMPFHLLYSDENFYIYDIMPVEPAPPRDQ